MSQPKPTRANPPFSLQRVVLLLVGLAVAFIIFKTHVKNLERITKKNLLNYVQSTGS
jgi:hypothetical protein